MNKMINEKIKKKFKIYEIITIYIFNLSQLKKVIKFLEKNRSFEIIFWNQLKILINWKNWVSIIWKKKINEIFVLISNLDWNKIFLEKELNTKMDTFKYIKQILEKNKIKYYKKKMFLEDDLIKERNEKIKKFITKINKNLDKCIKNETKIWFITNSWKMKYFWVWINKENWKYVVIEYFKNKRWELSWRFTSYWIWDNDKKIWLQINWIWMQIYKHLIANWFKDFIK